MGIRIKNLNPLDSKNEKNYNNTRIYNYKELSIQMRHWTNMLEILISN